MASDFSDEIHCKVIYCGPASAGKSANLSYICTHVPESARGDLFVQRVGEGESHVEFIPLDMGVLFGRRVRFHLFSVPGGPGCEAERVSILSGADGLVFVADSQRDQFKDSLLSYRELETIANGLGVNLAVTPLVMQYNKRDLPDVVPISVLNSRLNVSGKVHVEAVASTGAGVLATLRAVSKLVVEKLQ